jgi:Transposase DDE domain
LFGARLPLWAPRGEAAHRQLPQATVIPPRGAKGQQAALPLALGGRFFPRIQRHTQRFRDLYRARAAVEREFGRLKHDYGLAPLRVRGLERVRLHADLTMLGRLEQALLRAREAMPVAA